MKIISFAWTTPAVLAGRKTRTRRLWDDDYAKRFHKGDIIQAWDHSPRTRKGKKVAEIILTAEPRKEPINLMTDDDFEKEGFAFLAEQGKTIWGEDPRDAFQAWGDETKDADGEVPQEYWILDFELRKQK